ncbi:low molecular weight phosphatase family protein [Salaquimonas pukyongi]|uniref:arsenate-mycothiol transferase ArsC n=1 Tax=Salaquimonas pukyongi TaxID=2712698 RepID=UPI001FCD3690|nr:low molecular weight phosphatase family protein [Salaquimonas pukyongi]
MNSIRSPMAERLFKNLYGTTIYCDSVGVEEGAADGFAAAVMSERGLDMTTHKTKLFDDLEDIYFDLIVTLSPQAHHRALDVAAGQAIEVEYWPTMDPSTIAGSREQVLEGYRQVRDALEEKIRSRFATPTQGEK